MVFAVSKVNNNKEQLISKRGCGVYWCIALCDGVFEYFDFHSISFRSDDVALLYTLTTLSTILPFSFGRMQFMGGDCRRRVDFYQLLTFLTAYTYSVFPLISWVGW